MPSKTPGPRSAKDEYRLSISRGKQDGSYHAVTKHLDLPIRLLVMRNGRPPHQQVQDLVDESLAKVKGIVSNDLSKAVHVWAGKVIAYYKYISLKEMKAFVDGANKSDLFRNFRPVSDEKREIFTVFWDNYYPQNAEKVFLWVARFVHFSEPLSSDGIMPPGSFWMKTFFVNLAVKTKLYLDAPNDPDSTWPELQAFFDSFPQRHPFHHKVHVSDFKIRKEPKSIRHPRYFYGPHTADDDSAIALLSAATAATAATTAVDSSSVRRVVREPVSSARLKIKNRREILSARRRSVREMSSSSTIVSDGEVCVSSSQTKEIELPYQQGRINQIKEGSFLDNMTITDYVLKSNTFQTLLLYKKS